MHWAKWDYMCKPNEKGGMGFRDVRSFNKALLAKQVWRMIKNPQSLVARVFKGRYFKNGDVMRAEVKANASFTWRSLAWSRSIIERGCIWHVGNGQNIDVFNDMWVRGLHEKLVGARTCGGRDGLRVSELVCDRGAWDVGKIEGMFMQYEVEKILRTPIREHGEKYDLIWKFDEKWQFSVKSAYLVEIGYFDGEPNRSATDRKIWSQMVWNMSIPPKAKIFMWRALSNIIPTAANLHAHHVSVDGVCSLCRSRWGTTEHCLLLCPRIIEVWRKSRFWRIIKRSEGLLMCDVAWAIRKEYGVDDYEVWAIMVWQVWVYVCGLTHNRKEQVEATSEGACLAMWESFQATRPTIAAEASLGMCVGKEKWFKPRNEVFRVDVDSLFMEEENVFGVGVVVRNSRGEVVVASTRRTGPSSSVMMAEVMAVVYGITLCVEYRIAPIEIFTDSILAARLMENQEEERELLPDDICVIIKVARKNLLMGVHHMLRSANKVAHALARYARVQAQPTVWKDSLPIWLKVFVLADMFDQ